MSKTPVAVCRMCHLNQSVFISYHNLNEERHYSRVGQCAKLEMIYRLSMNRKRRLTSILDELGQSSEARRVQPSRVNDRSDAVRWVA